MGDIFDRIAPDTDPKQSQSTGDIFDRISPDGPQLKANRFAADKSKSLLYGIPAFLKEHGFQKTGDVVEGGLDTLAGLGSGIASTALGAADAVIPDSIEPDFIKAGRGYMHDVSTASTPAAIGQGAEQMAEFFLPVPGTGKLKAAAKGAGLVKRALLTGAKDAIQTGVVEHAQTGGDFGRSVPVAVLGGAVGAIGGAAGATYDRIAGLTHDVSPERALAAAYGKSEGVLVDPATRTGSPVLKNTKKFLSSGVNAPEAEELAATQERNYADVGDRLVQRAGGGNPVLGADETGQSGYDALRQNVNNRMAEADQAFGGFRAMTKMLPSQQLPVTQWEMVPTGQVDAFGNQVLQSVQKQVNKYFKIPVDRTPVQQALRPVLDQWEQTLPITEKHASRGLLALRNLVYGDSVVEADAALKDLSALYDAQKLEGGQIARDLNQGLATRAMREYRQAADSAIRSVNPSLLDAVNQGRAATGRKYAVMNLMKRLGGRVDQGNAYSSSSLEPVTVYNNLTKAKDRGITALTQFKTEAPTEVPKIAATLIDGLLDKASAGGAEGSFSRSASVLNYWNNIGPQTKDLLYGPELTKDLDNFFRLGKYLAENPNPSNTGIHVQMAARLMGLLSHPMIAAKDTAFEYALGKYIFSNGGALPYISEIVPGRFGVNPAAAIVGGIFRSLTGISPASFQKKEKPNNSIDWVIP